MAKQNKVKHRNHIRQIIPAGIDRNGNPTEERVVFHPKKFHKAQFANMKAIWNELNQMPKPNSKRQKKLNEAACCRSE